MNITIREITEIDLSHILALYSQPDMSDKHVLTLEDAREIFNKTKNYPNYRYYVAENSENTIVGSFGLLIIDRLDHAGDTSGILAGVVVHQHYHRHGIGKKMMHYAMNKCREAHCYKLILSSNIKRKNAHQFYESLGFNQHGISFAINF